MVVFKYGQLLKMSICLAGIVHDPMLLKRCVSALITSKFLLQKVVPKGLGK